MTTYTIAEDGQSITCHKCGRTSHNLNDVKQAYCGFCHVFHDDKSIPESACPTCGTVMGKALPSIEDAREPQPGDVGVCWNCGDALELGPDMKLRVASLKTLMSLAPEASRQFEEAQAKIRERRPVG